MPASMLYGKGMRDFVAAFLTANKTSRKLLKPWRICKHDRILSTTYSELCLWIVEESKQPNQYTVWIAVGLVEASITSWLKFVYRCVLAAYIVYILWNRYYRHYIPLLSNLKHLGLTPDNVRYEIVVGDPAYAILSNPIVTFGMVVDNWWGMGYVTLALIRASQFQDMVLYVSGCIYLSRYVWLAYLGMRILSSLVKWRRWEASFAPVDPAFLAVCAYVYSGPMMTLMLTTSMVYQSYQMAGLLLPPELENQAIEGITGTFLLNYAKIYNYLVVSNQVRPLASSQSTRRSVSDYWYNDMKAILLFALTMKKQAKRATGAVLHELYQDSPRYHSIPLFSHRAADCFILCYNADGSVDRQVRLSLLSWLDPQLGDATFGIRECTSLHFQCVCVINNEGCPSFMPVSKSAKCIHAGDLDCQWVM
ncbi:hypothetical protein Ae201684_011747 [Aphanomyces euteiches]|uniref:Uncharacterized protein n=1 Tax=Aphanomyces euteiches TaxID=100861 RepID=A0A6G0WTU5_9STRA|nr:hypothetical protein Ae201684_011747 [Aphanomyces euteiches]